MSDSITQQTNYEFTPSQNVEFRSAAYWMGIVGRLAVLFGLLFCGLGGLSMNIPLLIQGLLAVICAIWILKAGSAFRKVAETAGNDINNVMDAVVNLKKLYRLQAILILIAALVVLLSIGAIMFLGSLKP